MVFSLKKIKVQLRRNRDQYRYHIKIKFYYTDILIEGGTCIVGRSPSSAFNDCTLFPLFGRCEFQRGFHGVLPRQWLVAILQPPLFSVVIFSQPRNSWGVGHVRGKFLQLTTLDFFSTYCSSKFFRTLQQSVWEYRSSTMPFLCLTPVYCQIIGQKVFLLLFPVGLLRKILRTLIKERHFEPS